MNADAQTLFVPVILAGGSGERFWPLFRKHRPKQFLTLDDSGRSLLQATADRLTALVGHAARIIVVTGRDHRTQVLEQLPDMPVENLLVEPTPRDTAAAILTQNIKQAVQQLKSRLELERFV